MRGRVLVVEDDVDIADLLQQTLDQDQLETTVAPTGEDALALVRAVQPDVILLDLDLPDADGLELVEPLTRQAPVIVLTGRVNDDATVIALERGAEDYVTKPFSPRVLVARIDVVLRRREEPPARLERGRLVIDFASRTATLGDRPLELTRRELDLLAHLAGRAGTVVGRDELLQAVWQSSADWQTPATVTEHVRRIRIKLAEPGWIESVRGVGYRFVTQT